MLRVTASSESAESLLRVTAANIRVEPLATPRAPVRYFAHRGALRIVPRSARSQINNSAVVAVGFAAAAFHLFRANVALNQIFRGQLRGGE